MFHFARGCRSSAIGAGYRRSAHTAEDRIRFGYLSWGLLVVDLEGLIGNE